MGFAVTLKAGVGYHLSHDDQLPKVDQALKDAMESLETGATTNPPKVLRRVLDRCSTIVEHIHDSAIDPLLLGGQHHRSCDEVGRISLVPRTFAHAIFLAEDSTSKVMNLLASKIACCVVIAPRLGITPNHSPIKLKSRKASWTIASMSFASCFDGNSKSAANFKYSVEPVCNVDNLDFGFDVIPILIGRSRTSSSRTVAIT